MRAAVLVLAVAAGCGGDHAKGDAPPPGDAAADANRWQCNGTTGLVAPLPAMPPLIVPVCKTRTPGRAVFDDGPPRTWTDPVTGDDRAACVSRPASAGLHPLIVFLHGAGGAASQVYDSTSLRAKAAAMDFAIAADAGRTLDNPNGKYVGVTARHDIYYRDLGSPSTSPDVRNLDRLIDELVAEGGIDPKRIYLAGWSNGGFFSEEYAIARHATATPGGNRIAAALIVAAASPFDNLNATQSPSCAYAPLPQSDVPIYLVHRTCDAAIACDQAQHEALALPPGFDATAWLATLRGPIGDGNVTELLLDDRGAQATACAAAAGCTVDLGLANHTHWPDGVEDGGGMDWEPQILAFLFAHPLP